MLSMLFVIWNKMVLFFYTCNKSIATVRTSAFLISLSFMH